jgi:hypothetical protein
VLNDETPLQPSQMQNYEQLGKYKPLASVYHRKDLDEYYYVHPEVVTSELTVMICRTCKRSIDENKIPDFSIANGFDYGDINRMPNELQPLRFAEAYLICAVRMYGSIIKLKQDGIASKVLSGHIISFLHDGPEAAAHYFNTFPNMEALQHCKVLFFWTSENFEKWRKGTIACHGLKVRLNNVFNWLKMLKAVNTEYQSCVIEDTPEIRHAMRNFAEHLAKTALLENNGKYSGMDDIASDDVARVRTTMQQDDNASVVQQVHIGDPSDMAEVMLINPRQDNLVRNVDAEMGLQVEAIKDNFFPNIIARRCTNEPINEFTDNMTLLLKGFAHLFIFGKNSMGKLWKGSLPPKYVRHLLYQRTLKFAQDKKFCSR